MAILVAKAFPIHLLSKILAARRAGLSPRRSAA
jgi:hypothetical protein